MGFAGAMVLASVLLAVTVSHAFLYVTVFVGANLFQAAFTGFCPLASILRAAGLKDGNVLQRAPRVG
jgi:hypothetical protein